jgi:peptidoglycan/LPS O-acetylase OafA/YrhL
LLKVLYFFTGLGHEAVIVFFVISGYLVGGLAVIRYPLRGFDLADFAVHRIGRIYTVLVPALLLGGMLDWLGLRFFNASNLYTAPAHLDFVIANNLNLPTFILNLVNLQAIAGQRLGSNSPLWSLAFEWWYYVIFAAAMTATIRGPVLLRVLSCATLIVIATLMPHFVLIWGLVWLIGMATALYGSRRSRSPVSRFRSPLSFLGSAEATLKLEYLDSQDRCLFRTWEFRWRSRL